MVTKSVASTPFGTKLIYKINGECIWSEYLSFSPTSKESEARRSSERSAGMLGSIKRGIQSALFLKAS